MRIVLVALSSFPLFKSKHSFMACQRITETAFDANHEAGSDCPALKTANPLASSITPSKDEYVEFYFIRNAESEWNESKNRGWLSELVNMGATWFAHILSIIGSPIFQDAALSASGIEQSEKLGHVIDSVEGKGPLKFLRELGEKTISEPLRQCVMEFSKGYTVAWKELGKPDTELADAIVEYLEKTKVEPDVEEFILTFRRPELVVEKSVSPNEGDGTEVMGDDDTVSETDEDDNEEEVNEREEGENGRSMQGHEDDDEDEEESSASEEEEDLTDNKSKSIGSVDEHDLIDEESDLDEEGEYLRAVAEHVLKFLNEFDPHPDVAIATSNLRRAALTLLIAFSSKIKAHRIKEVSILSVLQEDASSLAEKGHRPRLSPVITTESREAKRLSGGNTCPFSDSALISLFNPECNLGDQVEEPEPVPGFCSWMRHQVHFKGKKKFVIVGHSSWLYDFYVTYLGNGKGITVKQADLSFQKEIWEAEDKKNAKEEEDSPTVPHKIFEGKRRPTNSVEKNLMTTVLKSKWFGFLSDVKKQKLGNAGLIYAKIKLPSDKGCEIVAGSTLNLRDDVDIAVSGE